MPEFPIALRDPVETLTVALSKPPSRGEWFDTSGLTVKVEDVRWIASEPVIFGARVTEQQRALLNPKKQRRVLPSH